MRIQLERTATLFQPCYFEAIVTVNLTTMLVLTSLFIGVSNSQPITAYPKMIDIWYERSSHGLDQRQFQNQSCLEGSCSVS